MPISAPFIPPGQPSTEYLKPRAHRQPELKPAGATRHIQSTQGTTIQKTILLSLGEIAIPSNSKQQTQQVKQNGETDVYAPNERIRQAPS